MTEEITEELHSFLADMTLEVPTWWHVKPQYKEPYDKWCQLILSRTLLKNQEKAKKYDKLNLCNECEQVNQAGVYEKDD